MSFPIIDWPELSLQVMVTFGHFLWQACAVVIALTIVDQLSSRVRRHSAAMRYAFACVAFFALPVCVGLTFSWVHQSRGPILLEGSEPMDVALRPLMVENTPTQRVVSANTLKSAPLEGPDPVGLSVKNSVSEPLESVRVAKPFPSRTERIQAFAPYLFVAYAIGVVVMLARFGVSIVGSLRLRQTLHQITDSELLQTIARLSAKLGLKRKPMVGLCQRVNVPVVVGIIRPVILLPPALLIGLEPNQLVAVLSHEMAHIRRHDLLVNLMQRIVESLLFFHPVTWWISRRISNERENCCDDMAAVCNGSLSYANALLKMAELCLSRNPMQRSTLTTLSATGGNPSQLARRIRRLIGSEHQTQLGVSRRAAGLVFATLMVAGVSLVALGQSQESKDAVIQDESMSSSFSPDPVWQTNIEPYEVGWWRFPDSPIVVAGDRVLTVATDLDLLTGTQIEAPFERLPRIDEHTHTLDVVLRRKSSDRAFIVEVSQRGPGATGSQHSCDIRVLRAIDGKQVGITITLPGFVDGNIFDVDIESGGNFLLLGDRKGVRVYRIETGKVETTLPVQVTHVDAVAFCPDHEWLVVSGRNNLHFWRWRDQAEVNTIYAGRKVDYLKFTPDGQYLAEGPDTRKDIQIRDMRTLKVVASLKVEVDSPMNIGAMDITPDGRFLVSNNTVSVDPNKLTIPHRIHVWDLNHRERPVFQIATNHRVRQVAFTDDGTRIVGELSSDSNGVLMAAWDLPGDVINRKVDSQTDAKDRLGDGIQWSTWGDRNGLLSGARLILPENGIKPGQPLVVEYRLANVSNETKTLECCFNKGMKLASLGRANRIGGFGLDWHREPVTLTIDPGEVFVDTEHLVSIDTKGLAPGKYHAALGSAFRFPDVDKATTTHSIPHRGSIPFTIVGESPAKLKELQKSNIHWGMPIAGLQLGATFADDPAVFTIGATVVADLFVANVTDQPIECSVVLPHSQDGWLFNVEDHNGDTVMLERPMMFRGLSLEQYLMLNLAPGEIAPITGKGTFRVSSTPTLEVEPYQTTMSTVRFAITGADKEEKQTWPRDASNRARGTLVSEGGQYTAIVEVTLLRPEIPALRLNLDTGNVPFSVAGPSLKPVGLQQPAKSDDEVESARPRNTNEWGPESDGLRCRIVPVSTSMDPEDIDMADAVTRFESPDQVTLAVEIKNVSQKPIHLKDVRYGNSYSDGTKGKLNVNHYAPHLFDLTFTNAAGIAMVRAQREFITESHAHILSSAKVTKLKPDQSLKCLLQPSKFERSMNHRLPPGDYKVQVKYRGPNPAVREWFEANNTLQQPEDAWSSQVASGLANVTVGDVGFRKPVLVWGAETDGLQAALEVRVPHGDGIPTQRPGVLPTDSLSPILHVKNVSNKPIRFVSETGRQGDRLQIKSAKGRDIKVKDVWMSGWPIDVRWTLQPGEVAELDVLTPALNQGLLPGEYSTKYTIRFNSRQLKDEKGNQIFPAPGDYDSEIDTGWTPLFLRDPKQEVEGKEKTTSIQGRVRNVGGKPIVGATVSFLGQSVRDKNAFKPIHVKTNQKGSFSVTVPSRDFHVHIGSPNDIYDSIRGFTVRDGLAVCSWEGVQDQSTDEKIDILATLPHRYSLKFEIVDVNNNQQVENAAILYKQDETNWSGHTAQDYATEAAWVPYQVIENGEESYKASTHHRVDLAHILVFATGYQQVQFKLDEALQRGRPNVRLVKMIPIDPVDFLLTTSNGGPAAAATIETLKSAELRRALILRGGDQLKRLLKTAAQSDEAGRVRFPWPAFSDWTTYRLKHPSGYVNVKGRDLPRGAAGKSTTQRRIRLSAYTGMQGTYAPRIGKNQFLEVCRLESDRMTVATRGPVVSVDQSGRFQVTQRLAGWHCFVHRARHTDAKGRKGTTAIGLFGPFQLSNGQMLDLTLGKPGRSVIGRLKSTTGRNTPYDALRLTVSSGRRHAYPRAPKGLDSKASRAWWEAYWESDKGHQYRESQQRHVTTVIASDGGFYFPSLPPGKYKLQLAGLPRDTSRPTLETTEIRIPGGTDAAPLDLGHLLVQHAPPAASNGTDSEYQSK